ncbi:aryl-alcohol dehydrogenase-like predicted oxidoreductase [Bradyrhizobium liaoningense]
MEYRNLGASGLRVPVLSFGTGTFGGQGPLFSVWGRSNADEARRLIDICLDAGVNLFDSADVYSNGASEEILGAAIRGRRDKVLISTKMSLPTGEGPHDAGSSRQRLLTSVDAALRRLGTDHIDLLQPTLSTPSPRSRRCCRPSTCSCARASCAMSASPISPAGS